MNSQSFHRVDNPPSPSMRFGLCQSNLHGIITQVDDRFAALFRLRATELVGRHYLEVTAKSSRLISEQYFENFRETGQPYILRKDYLDAHGNAVPTLVSVCPLKDQEGVLRGSIAICQSTSYGQMHDRAERATEEPAAWREPPSRLSGGQIRAARGWLGWSVKDLSEASGVSPATINRFEAGSDAYAIRPATLAALREVFVQRRLSFPVDPTGALGVTLSPEPAP